YKKTGAPSMEVKMPTGSSLPGSTTRQSTSAQSRNSPPASAARGTRRRWSAPNRSRTPWGTTSPTKPMIPAAQTARPVIRAVTARQTIRRRCRSVPRVRAVSSPSSIRLRARLRVRKKAVPSRAASTSTPLEGQLAAAMLPMVQRARSEEHTSELQSRFDLVCRLLLEKKNNTPTRHLQYNKKKTPIKNKKRFINTMYQNNYDNIV